MTTMMSYRYSIFSWLTILFGLSPSFSHNYREVPAYVASFSSDPIVIDGILDDRLWQHAVIDSHFVDLESCEVTASDMYFQSGYDDDYLYFAISACDTNIVASISDDNQPLHAHDPTIELFLDPHGDGLDYYEFQINPNSAKWQLSLTKPYSQGGKATDPDMIDGLLSNVHINGTINDNRDTDYSWTVEVAIPWIGLARFCQTEDMTNVPWSINIARVHHNIDPDEKAKYEVWSCAAAYDMHRPERWGELSFD